APGGSTHSFGIHVARMAGMPPSLIERANEILTQLEEVHVNDSPSSEDNGVQPATPKQKLDQTVRKLAAPQMQLSIFDAHSQTFEEIRKMLTDMDINRLTPVEALMKLNEIKELLK
ncbi:MAG: DNA mismatch repair protein MutS, partial [Bacteroidota bacterium]|nr:DNA mismatch repair protein MutS [Bacteroidota bacterium]